MPSETEEDGDNQQQNQSCDVDEGAEPHNAIPEIESEGYGNNESGRIYPTMAYELPLRKKDDCCQRKNQ